MKLDNHYEIRKDKECWTLIETLPVTGRKGQPSKKRIDRYYGNLGQALRAYLDYSALHGQADDVTSMLNAIESAHASIRAVCSVS